MSVEQLNLAVQVLLLLHSTWVLITFYLLKHRSYYIFSALGMMFNVIFTAMQSIGQYP